MQGKAVVERKGVLHQAGAVAGKVRLEGWSKQVEAIHRAAQDDHDKAVFAKKLAVL